MRSGKGIPRLIAGRLLAQFFKDKELASFGMTEIIIMIFPEPIEKFKSIFSKLPSIGPRQASRLAFYFLKNKEFSARTISSLKELLEKMSICPNCFLVFEKKSFSLCPICLDKNRNQKIICLLEKEIDFFSIENTGQYKGAYHILGKLINPSDPETYKSLRLETLEKRIAGFPEKVAEEIIIAANPTTEGDLTAMYLERRLKDRAKKITRLGRGLSTGGEIEFADEETIGNSLRNRN